MKSLICLGLFLLCAQQLYAGTYSWVDDNGTYNYTEDYSRVPKKFQKKVKRYEDVPGDAKPQLLQEPVTAASSSEKGDVKSAGGMGDEHELYGGKSRADWRRELDIQEAELVSIEQRMEQLMKQMTDPKQISKVQFELLKKEYDDSRAAYSKKYMNYNAMIETIRKAGIRVDIKQ